MALEPLTLPPGIRHNGTDLENKGRWFNANLVRFFQGAVLPVGGSRVHSKSALTGKGRAIISWHDNTQNTWTVIGTHSHLYAMTRDGTVSDITPSSGFTAGNADASQVGGYGTGVYGVGVPYGQPIPSTTSIQQADVWALDNFGQYLVGVMPTDGNVWSWLLNTGVPAAKVTGAPACVSLLTTAEGMLMTFGAQNNPRLVEWSDQQDYTTWTATSSNQAGDFQLGGTNGSLQSGLRVKNAVLIGTDVDMWVCNYLANNLVYSFNKVGADGCGFISRACAIAVDVLAGAMGAQAVWMGQNGFYYYNGFVAPLPCDVWDYVFNNLNQLQKSKITVEKNTAFGEITWRYPSGGSTEVDSYVTFNYREGHWSVGKSSRLCGVDAGVNSTFPMRVNNTDGNVYEHEIGNAYDAGQAQFLETGPLENGNGDMFQEVNELIPDSQIIPYATVTFFTKEYPGDASELAVGPFTLDKNIGIRGVGGRQIRVRFDFNVGAPWRLGINKMDMVEGDGR